MTGERTLAIQVYPFISHWSGANREPYPEHCVENKEQRNRAPPADLF